MLGSEYSCTLTPNLPTLGLAPVTNAAIFKAVVDVFRSNYWLWNTTIPPFLYYSLPQLRPKVTKVRVQMEAKAIIHRTSNTRYSKKTIIRIMAL